MKLYNFNTKNTNAWKHYQKNYITPLSYSVNSLFDYILNFNPDYDILNRDSRKESLKDNYNFMQKIGFYWAKNNKIVKLDQQPEPKWEYFVGEEGQPFDTKDLDIRQGWVFYHNEEVVIGQKEAGTILLQPRDGDIFIKTAPEGEYGGYWIPQGNMGLYLPNFSSNQLIFDQQKYEEDSAEWDFNFDTDIFRFICTPTPLTNKNTITLNNIGNPMIWTLTSENISKSWTGQPIIPQIVADTQEEIITDAQFIFDKTYQNRRYYNTLTVNLNRIKLPCHLQVC